MTESWKKAQAAERKFHTDPFSKGYPSYFRAYEQYFAYLDLNFDLKGKSILEIGPADYPALGFCINADMGHVIEPMPSSILMEILDSKGENYSRITNPLSSLPEDNGAEKILDNLLFLGASYDQIWIFNVLQHVMDPDLILRLCRMISKEICIFEPVNTGITDCHLHGFTPDYFQERLGDCLIHYPGNPYAENFHTHECIYGKWQKS